MNVLNDAAIARATTEHTRLENWQLIRGHLVGTVSGPSRSCRWRDDPHQRCRHRCETPARTHSQSRVPVGKSRSDVGATARTDALQPRRGARNRCTSQFDTGPRRAQTLIPSPSFCNHLLIAITIVRVLSLRFGGAIPLDRDRGAHASFSSSGFW
jgi:hypothetical protein